METSDAPPGPCPKRITSHAIGTVFADVQESGAVRIAAMNYTRKGRTTLRVPMGKGLLEGGESLTDTQIRELIQEAAEDPSDFGFKLFFQSRLVYFELVPDDNKPESELHLKAFFAAELTSGQLRTHRLVEHEGTEGEETLDRLVWYSADDLFAKMSERGRTPRCHALAVMATMVKLAEQFPRVASHYRNLVDRAAGQMAQLPVQDKALVFNYLKQVQG